jgi:crotonobetainyl-CoA:carnitine CoA-transferase CaiB-like acyl-CoA transferase
MGKFESLFEDLHVIELATALAGPITATFFKELGATVLKIEPPHGDVSRSWKNPFENKGVGTSIYYDSVNGHKNHLVLDLKKEIDQKKFQDYLQTCDILITNLSDRKAEKLNLTYAQIKKVKSDIILANITGYGAKSDKPAFDMMIQADSGLLSMTGYPDQKPAKVPMAIADILASHQLREGILCALLKKMQTGDGSEIQVSLIDSMISALTYQAGNYLMGRHIPQPMGTLHPGIAPYGDIFETADRKSLILAIGSDRQFADFCQALHRTQWIEDSRYHTNGDRVANRRLLTKDIQKVIGQFPADFWLSNLETHAIPAALIRNLGQVLDDPALRHLLVIEETDDHLIKRVKTVVF